MRPETAKRRKKRETAERSEGRRFRDTPEKRPGAKNMKKVKQIRHYTLVFMNSLPNKFTMFLCQNI